MSNTDDKNNDEAGNGPTTPPHPLICFESNHPPRLLPSPSLESTTVTLIHRAFSNSYYNASLLDYSPSLLPKGFADPQRWVSLTLTQRGSSRGRQFDRLGSVWLAGVEVWRTDNPEPTVGGVVWTTRREVDRYYDLFKGEGRLVFDYPNIVNDVYTGVLDITLELEVTQLKREFTATSSSATMPPSHRPLSGRSPRLLPLSKRNDTGDSKWAYPSERAITRHISLPRTTQWALVEVYASGTAGDEFWYTGAPDSVVDKAPKEAGLTPRGPYREVQVKVDGILAGIASPYAVIFTGGISPLMWRPQVYVDASLPPNLAGEQALIPPFLWPSTPPPVAVPGQRRAYGAYRQPTYLFDVSPFLGILADGAEHEVELSILSAEKNGSIPESWFLSGNIQYATSERKEEREETWQAKLGNPEVRETHPREGLVSTGKVKEGGDEIEASVRGKRSLSVVARGRDEAGAQRSIEVEYSFDFSNTQHYTNGGNTSVITQLSTGSSSSHHSSLPFLDISYSLPLTVRQSFSPSSGQLNTTVAHSYDQTLKASDSLLKSWPEHAGQQSVKTTQHSEAEATIVENKVTAGVGSGEQSYEYTDSANNTFREHTAVYNGSVTTAQRQGNLASLADPIQA
ncbi:hypothetical protein BDZ90DRAFT_261197 [Jaminaea rosea]|uniref:Peptide N-acetyl-beta-D-glucosaminyl asparaginase amidase A N-terminal domain-containing protein n=1 Tax=Jaminaea rosea TaxID=1569628 RepID=A0A316UNU6_9BASI|nr:hypothetical protein BDZ90DRAFT_261197 [Jaminaea rosea]PWN26949.1 hypothetical protein BDZ90DRAFT_261197 [Jaminaea rosea]